jgi:DNA primase
VIFDLVKQNIDIVNEIGKYVQLKKEGKLYKGLCPFHADKDTLSLVVYSDSWWCYGCGKGGSIIDFIMHLKSCTAIEACTLLCEEHHIQISSQDLKRWENLEAVRKEKKEIFDNMLPSLDEKPSSRDYLKQSRMLSDETIKAFNLGYGMKGNCIVIPIQDKFGRPVAFARRFLGQLKPGQPKYINDATDEIYDKSKILFNLHNVRQALKETNIVFVNEGYFDTITFWECGYKTAVAFCFATMTKEQAGELKGIINNETVIVLVPNNDATGQSNLEKNRNMLRGICTENHMRILALPEGYKDLNDYLVAKGKEETIRLIGETVPADIFLVKRMLRDEKVKEKQYGKAKKLILEAENTIVVDDMINYLSKAWDKEKAVVSHFLKGKDESEVDISKLKKIEGMMDDYVAQLREGGSNKIFTGYSGIDKETRGLCGGEVMSIIAGSGVGKTALAINIMRNVGERQNVPMMFYSLEQPAPQVFERFVTIESGRELTGREVEENLKGGGEHIPSVNEVLGRMAKHLQNLVVVDENSLTVNQIEHYTKQAGMLIFGEPVSLLVIDYLGYIEGEGRDIYQVVSKVAKSLKGLAKKLNVKIIVLHQITKQGGTGGDPVEGFMARDSGVILESSDYMLGAWRPCLKEGLAPNEIERLRNDFMIKILKNRKGRSHVQFTYCFVPETLRIYDSLESITEKK